MAGPGCALRASCLAACSRLQGTLRPVWPTPTQVSHGIYWSCTLFELLLLAKAVVVAILGEERLLPPPEDPRTGATGESGLACMYAAILAALLSSFLEAWLARSLVARWRKQHEAAEAARGEARQPLLGGKAAKPEVICGGRAGGRGECCSSLFSCVQQQRHSMHPSEGASLPLIPSIRVLPVQHEESATIAELMKLSLPDSLILLLAFSAGAVAALGQASAGREGWQREAAGHARRVRAM